MGGGLWPYVTVQVAAQSSDTLMAAGRRNFKGAEAVPIFNRAAEAVRTAPGRAPSPPGKQVAERRRQDGDQTETRRRREGDETEARRRRDGDAAADGEDVIKRVSPEWSRGSLWRLR